MTTAPPPARPVRRDPTREEITARALQAVRDSRLLYADVAAHAEMTVTDLAQALGGQQPLSSLKLALIAEITGARISWILWGDDAPTCTGVAATWCEIHGDCTCRRHLQWTSGDWPKGEAPSDELNDPRCPLHSARSTHAAESMEGTA